MAARRTGEIPGVYKYCDDWCEFCRVTARCTSHRVRQAWEARRREDPAMDADDLVAFTREVAAAAGETTPGLDALLAGDPNGEYQPAPADERLLLLASQYTVGAGFLLTKAGWRPPASGTFGRSPGPQDVLAWYHLFLAMRASRALVAAARADRGIPGERDDAEGSAKIALIGIDRSRAALELMAGGRHGEICRHLDGILESLAAGLEARIPGARAFVRIGLDVPVV
jgi:hypothetical protein